MAEVQRAQASLPALTGAQVRKLKSQGQKLEPVLHLGKAGMSEPFLQSLNEVLELHELVKVRLAEFKEERKTLAPQLAEKSNSVLIQQVGHVIILYRPNSDPAKRRIHL